MDAGYTEILHSSTQSQKCITHKQVSRLGFILLGHLPVFQQWYICPFVDLTVTGIAQDFHPIPSMLCLHRCLAAHKRVSIQLLLL